jgi:hypothetical protein
MPLATQVTNTPIHITSSSTGMSVTSAGPVVRVTDSIDVKFEPGLLSSAATGTIDIDANSAQVVYHSSSTGNFIFNFRGDSTTALSTTMQVGHVMTVSVIINNGTTAYYATSVKIDGSTKTIKWNNGIAPAYGSVSSCDLYTFNIIKLTDTPTYLILGTFGSYA